MTNREYMETLSNLDFSRFLFSEVLTAGKEYNDSILGIADWLGRERRVIPNERIFKSTVYDRQPRRGQANYKIKGDE